MSCVYEYNGLTFKSELELDHYLLFNKTRRSRLGDAVFKEQHKWSDEQKNIDDKLSESAKDYDKARNTKQINDSKEGGEPSDLDPIGTKKDSRYKSITDIIHKLQQPKNGELHPVFPIFQPEEYWNGSVANPIGQLQLYRQGQFNHENVIDQIPFVQDLLEKEGNSFKPVTNEVTLQKIRERMETVWKQQALCGDLVHDIMSDFFRHFNNLKGEELVKELEKKIQESFYNKTRKFCNPEIVRTTAEAAEK